MLIVTHDLVVTTAAFPGSMLLRENFSLSQHHFQPLVVGTVLVLMISALVFRSTGLCRSMWRYTSPRDLLKILQALILMLVLFIPAMFLLDLLNGVPRSVLIIFGLLAFTGLSGSRIVYGCCTAPNATSPKRHANKATIRVLLVGDVRSTAKLAQTIHVQYGDFVQIVGVIGRRADVGRYYQGMTVLGTIAGLKHALAKLDIHGMFPHQIIMAYGGFSERPEAVDMITSIAKANNVRVTSSSNLQEFNGAHQVDNAHYNLFDGILAPSGYQRAKRWFDFCLASFALIFLAPLLLLIACVTIVTMGSPILFKQIRAGRHMREFSLLKFRTMRDPFGPSGEILSDAERTSRFGRLLRATRLDELPQLWNIIVGDMALIGPRPLHSRDLSVEQTTLKQRYEVRPGLTGWAQVNGGQLLSIEQKMALDIYYIKFTSFPLDIKIILLTLFTVIFGEHMNVSAIEEARRSQKKIDRNNGDVWQKIKRPAFSK